MVAASCPIRSGASPTARRCIRTCATNEDPPDQLLKRFYFDALTHSGQSVRHLIETVGADRIVIGTDHPYDAGLDQPIAALE